MKKYDCIEDYYKDLIDTCNPFSLLGMILGFLLTGLFVPFYCLFVAFRTVFIIYFRGSNNDKESE